MTDVAGILASYRSGQISEADMVDMCKQWPEVEEALKASSITTAKLEPVEAGGCAPPVLASALEARQTLIAWATGRLDFIGERRVPDGAIRICTATGEDAINFLFHTVKEAAELHDFGTEVALKVPGIDPSEPGSDEAIDTLIDWDDCLQDEIGRDDAFDWQRKVPA